jgi:hypothetical protein
MKRSRPQQHVRRYKKSGKKVLVNRGIKKNYGFLERYKARKHKNSVKKLELDNDPLTDAFNVMAMGQDNYINPKSKTKLIIDKGNIIGHIGAFKPKESPDSLYVKQLYIVPNQRGKGYGKKTVNDLLKDKSIKSIHGVATKKAKSFWSKQNAKGFVRMPTRNEEYYFEIDKNEGGK